MARRIREFGAYARTWQPARTARVQTQVGGGGTFLDTEYPTRRARTILDVTERKRRGALRSIWGRLPPEITRGLGPGIPDWDVKIEPETWQTTVTERATGKMLFEGPLPPQTRIQREAAGMGYFREGAGPTTEREKTFLQTMGERQRELSTWRRQHPEELPVDYAEAVRRGWAGRGQVATGVQSYQPTTDQGRVTGPEFLYPPGTAGEYVLNREIDKISTGVDPLTAHREALREYQTKWLRPGGEFYQAPPAYPATTGYFQAGREGVVETGERAGALAEMVQPWLAPRPTPAAPALNWGAPIETVGAAPGVEQPGEAMGEARTPRQKLYQRIKADRSALETKQTDYRELAVRFDARDYLTAGDLQNRTIQNALRPIDRMREGVRTHRYDPKAAYEYMVRFARDYASNETYATILAKEERQRAIEEGRQYAKGRTEEARGYGETREAERRTGEIAEKERWHGVLRGEQEADEAERVARTAGRGPFGMGVTNAQGLGDALEMAFGQKVAVTDWETQVKTYLREGTFTRTDARTPPQLVTPQTYAGQEADVLAHLERAHATHVAKMTAMKVPPEVAEAWWIAALETYPATGYADVWKRRHPPGPAAPVPTPTTQPAVAPPATMGTPTPGMTPAPTTVPTSAPAGRSLTKEEARAIWREAGGDTEKARAIARARGFTF